MVAGEEDFGHLSSVPLGGAGVLGVFQQAVPVGFLLEALRVRQNAGDHAAHRIRHRHGRDLAAGEDEVAHGDLLVHALVDKPLVDALIVAADKNEVVVVLFQFPGDRLVEGAAAGGHENSAAGAVGLHDVGPAAVQRVRLHDGAPASAVRVVVHLHLLIGGVLPNLVRADGDVSSFNGPAQDADVEHGVHRVGEQSHNVNVHPSPSLPRHGPPCGSHRYPRIQ